MSYLRVAALGCALLLLGAVSFAHRQFSFGGPDGKAMVLLMPDIQKELKLSGEQKKKVNEEFGKFGKSMAAPDITNMSDPFAGLEAPMMAILEPEQRTRFDQIYLQYEGPIALTLDDVAAKVGLTEDQRSQMKGVFSKYKSDLMEGMQAKGGRAGNGMVNEMKKGWKAASAAAMALLTPEQNTAYVALQGKLIKMRIREY